jgi:hypothetical protein
MRRPGGWTGYLRASPRTSWAAAQARRGLVFACGQGSTEDWQDPESSRARQRDQAEALVRRAAGHRTSRVVPARHAAHPAEFLRHPGNLVHRPQTLKGGGRHLASSSQWQVCQRLPGEQLPNRHAASGPGVGLGRGAYTADLSRMLCSEPTSSSPAIPGTRKNLLARPPLSAGSPARKGMTPAACCTANSPSRCRFRAAPAPGWRHGSPGTEIFVLTELTVVFDGQRGDHECGG